MNNLKPFKKFCLYIGTLPSTYVECMSYYEALTYVIKYLEKEVIPTVNNNSEVVTELQNFVAHYFDNLDVQEEINNKLDEMAEGGTLQEIMAAYLETQALFTFDNVDDMQSATNFINGSYARTLGFYEKNDKGAGIYKIRNLEEDEVADEKFIITINETLVAELIYNNLNVKQIGAKGDSETDDTEYFQAALNKCKIVYVPIGEYIIDNLIINSENSLIGEDKFLSIIKQNEESLSNAIIKSDTTDDLELRNITLKNLTIESVGERTTYPIQLLNCNGIIIDNCHIKQNSLNQADSIYHGVLIDKTGGFVGNNFLTKIKNSRFSKSKIKMNSTDSYIINNEIWGDGLDCAIELVNASTTNISQNEIVGGKTYGGIYVTSSNEALKIVNNYFDGSYSNIDTKYGIYGNALIKHSVISNNTFWKQKSGAIYLKGSQENVISNNTFEENDYYNNGDSDIEITNTINSFNNIISNNTFFRNKYYDLDSNSIVDRPTVDPTPILNITNASGYPASIISNNTCSYVQFYGNSTYSGYIVARNNTSDKFFTTYNYDITAIKNDKDIIYTDNENNLLKKTSAVINGSLTRIDNVKVILSSSLTAFDCDGIINESYKVYINNTSGVTNLPSFFNNNALVEYEYIANNYGKQTFTGYDNSNNLYVKTRLLINGTWNNWSA